MATATIRFSTHRAMKRFCSKLLYISQDIPIYTQVNLDFAFKTAEITYFHNTKEELEELLRENKVKFVYVTVF